MFAFFKDASKVKVNDKIWMSTDAKWQACRDMLATNNSIVLVVWFEETFDRLAEIINGRGKDNVILADELMNIGLQGKLLIFVEHYPLQRKEQDLFVKLGLKEVPVLSSLDEPLFVLFGGEKLIKMMKQLGVEEGEVVGHTMVSNSIGKAQARIEKGVKTEQKTTSQKEWFEKNLNSRNNNF